MKFTISAILTIITFTAFGQRIHFQCSSEIRNTTDSSIAAVRDLWKAYLINSKEGFGKPSLEYWNNIEPDNGFTDIVKAAISIPSYRGDFQVYDLKRLENDYYRIRTIWSLEDPGNKLVLALFNFPITNPDTFDDDLSAVEKELGIKKEQVDKFLKDYIQNYFPTGSH